VSLLSCFLSPRRISQPRRESFPNLWRQIAPLLCDPCHLYLLLSFVPRSEASNTLSTIASACSSYCCSSAVKSGCPTASLPRCMLPTSDVQYIPAALSCRPRWLIFSKCWIRTLKTPFDSEFTKDYDYFLLAVCSPKIECTVDQDLTW
jgi:hypothetical protein